LKGFLKNFANMNVNVCYLAVIVMVCAPKHIELMISIEFVVR